jgi:hypothetical protein
VRYLLLVIAVACAFSVAAADSLNCRLVGTYAIPSSPLPLDVAVAGNLALVADWSNGLRIVNIADPTNPTQVGLFTGPRSTFGVAVKDTFTYVAGHWDGLYIANIADPANPQLVGQLGTPDASAHIALGDTFAYLADKHAGLRIVSVADPAHPYEVGRYLDTIGSIHNDVAVAGNFAYVATIQRNLLQVISIADPAHPSLAGQCSMPGRSEGVVVSGSYAYVAAEDLSIVDVSNPQNPQEVGRYVSPGIAADIRVEGNLAYVADGFSGLRVLDVSNPQQPQEVGYYDTPGYANGIDLAGDYIFVTEDPIGMRIFQFLGAGVEEGRSTPGASRIASGATVVRGVLELPRKSGTVKKGDTAEAAMSPGTVPIFALLDISGRKVLDLQPGANDVSRLAPGVYFVSVRSAVGGRRPADAVRRVVIQR